MKKLLFLLLSFTAAASFKSSAQAPSSIKVFQQSFVTYPFSDPDPIASQTAIYPYYRFDGFTNKPVNKKWTVKN